MCYQRWREYGQLERAFSDSDPKCDGKVRMCVLLVRDEEVQSYFLLKESFTAYMAYVMRWPLSYIISLVEYPQLN